MRLLVAGITAALLALSSATPAVAGDYVHTDGTGDMWRSGIDVDDGYHPDPSQVEGDITRVQMRHTRSHVQLFMTVREAKRETLNTFFHFELQNGRKKLTQVDVLTYRNAPDGVLVIEDGRNRDKRCRGLKGFKINWDTNTVAVTLPRTCFGRPKVLRVKPYDYVVYDSWTDYSDAGQSALDPYYGGQPWSRWVRRG